MLGDKTYVKNLQPYIINPGPYQNAAIEIAFRVLAVQEAHQWINTLAKNPEQIRYVIKATMALGDAQAIAWLIAQMRVPPLARLAGEAFTTITGIDIEKHKLILEKRPNLINEIPNDNPDDDNVEMDEDDNLPFPDIDKVLVMWQKNQSHYLPGQRYFMGKPIDKTSREHLQQVYALGSQRQRQAAALELALLDPQQFLLNPAAKEFAKNE